MQTQPSYRAKGQTHLSFAPDRTVLLVIDPVNDFLSEGGAGWELTKITVKMNGVIENLKRALEGARERGVPVLFGPMAYTEEDYADHELHRRSGINRIMFERKMFLAGSWGADFHPELRPREDEVVLQPHKGVDVFQTDLPEHLQRLNATTLVIAGMTANLCCESTGRTAMERGYDVTFLSDAIGAENVPAYEAAIHVNYPLIANAVITVDEFLSATETSAPTWSAIQPGDTLRGSDHGDIGTVSEVVAPAGNGVGYVVVPRGIVFEKETYIPLDAVVKRSGTTVFINVPKLVVGKMGWESPPTAVERQAKLGPKAESVSRLYASRSPSRDT